MDLAFFYFNGTNLKLEKFINPQITLAISPIWIQKHSWAKQFKKKTKLLNIDVVVKLQNNKKSNIKRRLEKKNSWPYNWHPLWEELFPQQVQQ